MSNEGPGPFFYLKNKIWTPFLAKIYRNVFKLKKRRQTNVLDKNWDCLIVIDACRKDLFEEIYDKGGSIRSAGSCTDEWFRNTFGTKNHDDIIYVSGNPVASKSQQKELCDKGLSFYKWENVWDYGWNHDLKTVPPEVVTEKALEIRDENPDKDIVVHYLQPHFPFIGETQITGSNMERWRKKAKDETISEKKRRKAVKLMKYGKSKQDKVWQAYKENLDLVMREVEKLADKLEGKTVLTSDHGNCRGEWGIYCHPCGLRFEELVRVPWVVL